MNCREVCNKMFDYIEHQLSQQEIKEFEEHMKDCKSCQDEYYKLEKLIVKLKNIKDIEPPSNLKSKILNNIKSEIDNEIKNKKSNIFYFKRYSYVAATVILFVGGFYILKAIENSPIKNDVYNVKTIDNYTTTTETTIAFETSTEATTENITEETTINTTEKQTKTIPQKTEIVTEITTNEEIQTKVESREVILQQEPLTEELTIDDLQNNKDNTNNNIDNYNLNENTPSLQIREAEIFNSSKPLQATNGDNFYYEKTIFKENNIDIFKYDIPLYKNQICNVYFENNSKDDVLLYIENIDGKKVSQDTIVEKNSNNSMQFYMTEEEMEQDVYTINVKAEDKNLIEGYLKIEILPKES